MYFLVYLFNQNSITLFYPWQHLKYIYSLHNTLMGQAILLILFKKQLVKQLRQMHLYKHMKNCYTYLMLNSSNCFIKIQTANITVNVGLNTQILYIYMYSCSEFILDGLKKKKNIILCDFIFAWSKLLNGAYIC